MKQTIEIRKLPPGLNGSGGLMQLHYHAYNNLKKDWVWMMKAYGAKKHSGSVIIRYTRVSTAPMDLDNVGASFKVVGDSLVGAKIVTDDSPDILTELILNWKKAKNKDSQGIIIEIEDV